MKKNFVESAESKIEDCHECLKSREPNEITKKAIEESFKKTKTDKKSSKMTDKKEKKYYNGIEIPEEEAWLFKPENKDLLESLQEGLRQKATIDRGSFLKYLKD